MSETELPPMKDGEWLVNGPVRVCFTDIGEGVSGDYNPDDPEDTPLLRVDCNVRVGLGYCGEDTDEPEWLYPQDGSICTAIPTTTDDERLCELLGMIAKDLRKVVESDRSVKHAMDRYSWLTATSTTIKEF